MNVERIADFCERQKNPAINSFIVRGARCTGTQLPQTETFSDKPNGESVVSIKLVDDFNFEGIYTQSQSKECNKNSF